MQSVTVVCCSGPPPLQVIKQRLAIAVPALTASNESGDLQYEEGEDLDPDEVEAYKALLPKALADLPGGGLKSGSVVMVDDYSQALTLNLHISHQVCRLLQNTLHQIHYASGVGWRGGHAPC